MEGFGKFLVKYTKDDIIYKVGDKQENFFIINKGKVRLMAGDQDIPLITLAKGQFFGEECLKENQLADFTVEAVENVDVLKIPYAALQDMMKKNSEISLKILKKLAEKNTQSIQNLIKITKTNVAPVTQEPQTDTKGADSTAEKLSPDIKAYLIIQRSNRIIQLTKKQTFLGRRDYTTGFVPDVDLTKEDEEKYISRKHAGITHVDGKFYVQEEPGAVNGTFLNGNKLNTGVKYELHNEDEMTLCHLQIVFKC